MVDNFDSQNKKSGQNESVPTALTPTIDFYEKKYSKGMDQNDQKAVSVFKNYESKEMFRRLQNELLLVKQGKVAESTLDLVVGKKTQTRYGSYQKWAEIMLLWAMSKR